MAIDTTYPYASASARGWGSGWPNCPTDKIVPLVVHGVSYPGGVHRRIRELTERLLRESETSGFFKPVDGWCWGFACRAIKHSDGSMSDVPSNHSWGLAIDINAPRNPYGGTTHEIPAAMGKLWNEYGYGWGGDYPSTKDWMHFEFVGTPKQADRMLAKARANGIGDLPVTYRFNGTLYFKRRTLMGAIRRRLGLAKPGHIFEVSVK